MTEIKSTSNVKYKYIKSLMSKKARMNNREYTVEGIKSVSDAIKAGASLSMLAVSDEFYENTSFDYPENAVLLKVDNTIFSQLCDTQTPQGIIAVIKMRDNGVFQAKPNGLYVYCDNVRDPGNLGTIIRTAEAAGFDAILLSEDCVDVYSPKVVRASMGSYFNIDIISDIGQEEIKKLKEDGMNILGGALCENTVDYREADYSLPLMIAVGNEANGITDEILELCQGVKIPIFGKAESLNVSVAAGLLIYEACRNER